MIKYLEDNDLDSKLKDKKILVDFYADWCGPCKMLGTILEEMDFPILKINVDKFPELARKYGVMSIPTIILFDNGKEIKKNIGFLSKNELEEFLKWKVLISLFIKTKELFFYNKPF